MIPIVKAKTLIILFTEKVSGVTQRCSLYVGACSIDSS